MKIKYLLLLSLVSLGAVLPGCKPKTEEMAPPPPPPVTNAVPEMPSTNAPAVP